MEVRDYVPRNAMAVLATLPIVLLMKKPEEGSKVETMVLLLFRHKPSLPINLLIFFTFVAQLVLSSSDGAPASLFCFLCTAVERGQCV